MQESEKPGPEEFPLTQIAQQLEDQALLDPRLTDKIRTALRTASTALKSLERIILEETKTAGLPSLVPDLPLTEKLGRHWESIYLDQGGVLTSEQRDLAYSQAIALARELEGKLRQLGEQGETI